MWRSLRLQHGVGNRRGHGRARGLGADASGADPHTTALWVREKLTAMTAALMALRMWESEVFVDEEACATLLKLFKSERSVCARADARFEVRVVGQFVEYVSMQVSEGEV